MKRTITTQVFAIASPYSRITPEALRTGDIATELMYSTTDMAGAKGYVVVGRGVVTVELLDTGDIAASQVAALRAQVKSVQAEAHAQVNRIEDQIRNLQALTYEHPVAEAA